MAESESGSELRIERDPSPSDIAALDARIYEFNVASTGCADGEQLAIFLRDADDALVGGISGTTWDGWLDIRLLWVREDQRGRGLGGQLLAAAEAEAIRRGCHTAILDTHSFQAPVFYQHRGFIIYATLEGYPSGQRKHFLKKPLLAIVPTAGALSERSYPFPGVSMPAHQTHAISTHVLDNERSLPAPGVRVTLERLDGDSFVTLTDLLTDADGRIPNLLSPFELEPATYQISWDAGGFYKLKGGDAPFVRIVSVAFQVTDTQRHYHVPLLMTRYACTTYRGS